MVDLAQSLSSGINAGLNRRAIRQDRMIRDQEFESAEKEKRIEQARTGLNDVVQTIKTAREQGANAEQLTPLARSAEKTYQMLVLAGDVPPESLATVQQILTNVLNTPTQDEAFQKSLEQKTKEETAITTAEETAKAEVAQKFAQPELRTVGNQIIQVQQNTDGTVETVPVFTGQEVDPKPETFFNPKTNQFFTVDVSNQEEVKKAQEIGAFKASPKTDGGTKEPSAAQRQAAGFGKRLEDASAVIDDLGNQFTGFLSRGAGAVPQGLKSEDRQRFDQAKRNFVNAVLRRESGASISQSEFDNAELQYFPQPGDSDEVIEQKTRNRQVVIEAMKLEAGSAFDQLSATLPQTVEIQGQTFTVGQIVTNGKGQKGRIEQDGSITLIP